MKKNMFSLKFERLQFLLHILAWTVLFCFPFIGRDFIHTPVLGKSMFHLSLLAAFFYLNMLVLIPRLLFRKKIELYAGLILVCLAAIVLADQAYDKWIFEPSIHGLGEPSARQMPPVLLRLTSTLLSALLVFGISTSLKVVKEYLKKEKEQQEIENKKLNSELVFLKSQINPHFLFNTLNNLYFLVHSGSPKTGDALLKLSDLMRYMLEDTAGRKVDLHKELAYIHNYVDLQRLRMHESVSVDMRVEGNFNNKAIEPLLLIPFIENAFKHGISYHEPSYIDVDLVLDKDTLHFTVRNSIPVAKTEKDSVSGIGLKNVMKRLELLYPGRHQLAIDASSARYSVNLSIEL